MSRHLDVWLPGLAAMLVYAGTLDNGFVYDDRFLVERDVRVQSLDWWSLVATSYWGGLVDAGLYRPLTLLSFGLNRAVGPSAAGFHLTNVALHAGASVLVPFVARSLGVSRFGALAAGLVFALHPAQSEAVASIVGRAELLAFLFTATALLLFARRAPAPLVGAVFFLALASKESAAFALPLFPLYAYLDEAAPAGRRYLGLAASVALYAACRAAALGGLGIAGREIGFLDNPLASESLGARILAAPAVFLEYVRLAVWPRVLSADYSYDAIPVPESLLDVRVAAGAAVLLLLIGLAWKGKRPAVRFGVLAFVVPLLGFLHLLFPLGTILAERLLYMPLLGVALLAGLASSALARRSTVAAALVLAAFSGAAALRVAARVSDWKDNETLFRSTVAASPTSARSHFLLGAELLEQARYAEAARSFERGLVIHPAHFGARMSLGQARLGAGEPARAAAAFEAALEREPHSEDARRAAVEASLAAGRAAARGGDLEEAAARFEKSLSLDPRSAEALNLLGLVRERTGAIDAATSLYERALATDPELVEAALNLASLRMRAGELSEAESLFREAARLAPDSYEAYNGLGIALARQNRTGEAAAAFRRAIAIRPELETARENLRALGEIP